jgi:uncharacterized protein
MRAPINDYPTWDFAARVMPDCKKDQTAAARRVYALAPPKQRRSRMHLLRSFACTASLLCILLSMTTVTAAAPCEPKCPAPAPLVFFDIAGPDLAKLRAFYSAVFGWPIDASNAIDRATTGLAGTLRQDPPEKVLYLGVPDVTAALAAIEAMGGTILSARFEVPGVVVLGLFKDPAGNRMGLVEMQDGKPKVPAPRK